MQGMPQAQLQSILDAMILACALYASSAWKSFSNAADIDCLQQLFLKAKRWQIVSGNYDVSHSF